MENLLKEETVTSVLTVIDAEDDGGSEERSQVLAQQVGGNHLHSLQLSRDCQGHGDGGVQVATAHSLRSFKHSDNVNAINYGCILVLTKLT